MTGVLLLLLGLALGAIAGVYLGILRGKAALSGEVARRGASLEEVRGQLAARQAELETARQTLQAEKVSTAESKTRLEAARENLAQQQQRITEMEQKLKESFGALSAAALRSNNEQFLTLADAKLKPLREQLERYEKQIAELEKARQLAYGGLDRHLATLGERSDRLSHETGQLVAALRHSGAKGKWGEIALQRIVELTGMTEHCDFDKQVSVTAETGRQRPDLIVRLPGDRTLVIDSKVNTAAYLDAANATDEAERKRHLEKYASDVRTTLRALGGKEYWKQFSPAPALVIMFMPGEAFFAAALSQDWDLIADGLRNGVLPASPTTLIALLHAVQHGWQQQQAAENAQKIVDTGRELYDRLRTFVDHLGAVGEGIKKAAEAYNRTLGSCESRVLPGARRLKELGAAEAGKELAELTAVDVEIRTLAPPNDGA